MLKEILTPMLKVMMLVKIAILASLATEKTVSYDDIYTEGITNISKTDMDYVKKMGCSIKLLATADLKTARFGLELLQLL